LRAPSKASHLPGLHRADAVVGQPNSTA